MLSIIREPLLTSAKTSENQFDKLKAELNEIQLSIKSSSYSTAQNQLIDSSHKNQEHF